MSRDRLIEGTPEEDLLRIVEREIHKKNKTSQIFREYHPAQIAKFEFSELEEGAELGRGGFCVVRELASITLEKDPHQELVVGENRDIVQGFSESPLGMVLTGRGFWQFGPDVDTPKEESANHFLSEDRRQQMAEDFCGEDGEFRYAIKSVQESARENKEVYIRSVMDLALEAQYLSILDHPNIITMRGMAATSPYDAGFPYFVVLDKLDDILSERMRVWKRQMPRVSGLFCCTPAPDTLWNERLAVAGDIARALAFLHDKNIIYRDLKCDNVGFVGNTLKLFDFGLAREMQKKLRTVEGTYQLTGGTGFFPYMSPEVALAKPYNESADVYSFAILLWEILKVDKPFGNLSLSEEDFVQHVIEGGARPVVDNAWPEELVELLQLGWSEIRTERPSITSVYQTLQTLLTPSHNKFTENGDHFEEDEKTPSHNKSTENGDHFQEEEKLLTKA